MACQNCSLVVSCKYSGSQNFLLYNVRRLTKVWGKFSSVAQSCSTLCDPMDPMVHLSEGDIQRHFYFLLCDFQKFKIFAYITAHCLKKKKAHCLDFPSGPVAKILRSQCRGPQHARPPCPSPTPGAYSHSCPSRW